MNTHTYRSHDGRGHGGSQPDTPLETINELSEGGGGGKGVCVLGGEVGEAVESE